MKFYSVSNYRKRLCALFNVLLLLVLLTPIQAQARAPVSFAGPTICVPDRIETPSALLPYLGQDHSGFSVELEADRIDSPSPSALTLVGNASAVQGAQAVYADRLQYNRKNRVVEASGDVVMHTIQGDRITADLLQLNLSTRIGRADSVYFQKAISDRSIVSCPGARCTQVNRNDWSIEPGVQTRMRGYAERTYFDGHDRERHQNVEVSRCVAGNDSVVLAASQIIMDHGTGVATGRNLRVRFFDIPIFYFPTVTFPISNERKTGFLFPTLAFGESHGSRLIVPYYWNISPNQDATITTDYMSARGTLLRGEYRYMDGGQASDYKGRIGVEIISRDRKFGGRRSGWSLLHEHHFSEYWSGQLDLGYISDRKYLDDFGDSLEADSAAYVPQIAKLNYQRSGHLLAGDHFKFELLVSDSKIYDPLIYIEDKPYARLPQAKLDWDPGMVGSLLEPSLTTVWTRFKHPLTSRSTGNRINFRSGVMINVKQDLGFVRPQLDLDLVSYRLDRRSVGEAWYSGSLVPVFSVDSGVSLERTINWWDQPWLQTLEPRLFYAFVPFVDQNDQPIFDDEEFELNSPSQYFTPNRFRRSDRVGDTNKVSVGLKSLIIEPASGKQKVEAELAQMFYLSDRNVRETRSAEPLTDRYSDVFGEVSVSLTDELATSVSVSWDWKEKQISTSRTGLSYRNYKGQYGLSYTFNRNKSEEELEGEFIWSVSPRWLASLNQTYSLEESKLSSTEFGLGYDGCCWAIQFHAAGAPVEFMVTLQLNGLGGITSNSFSEITSSLGRE